MDRGFWRRVLIPGVTVLALWMGGRYVLPVLLPFVLGWGFASLAEPGVRFLTERVGLPRGLASLTAVGSGFLMVLALVWILGAALYRQLAGLSGGLVGIYAGAASVIASLRDWSLGLAARAPQGVSVGLSRWLGRLFSDGSVLLEQAAGRALGMAGGLMEGLPMGALTVGTTVLASFMISAQLPSLKEKLRRLEQRPWIHKWVKTLRRFGTALGGWLRAQAKLSGITFVIVGAGLLLLRSGNPLLWAGLTALVDAVPVLGSGTVLIPWSLVCLIQGENIRALGLLGVYVTAMVTRSVLEPKFLGKQLGLNPLVTLLAIYAGFRLWGVVGMIFAPILAVTARQVASVKE